MASYRLKTAVAYSRPYSFRMIRLCLTCSSKLQYGKLRVSNEILCGMGLKHNEIFHVEILGGSINNNAHRYEIS